MYMYISDNTYTNYISIKLLLKKINENIHLPSITGVYVYMECIIFVWSGYQYTHN